MPSSTRSTWRPGRFSMAMYLNAGAQSVAPALFLLNGTYAAALHANNTIVGPAALVANNSTPVAPGETIVMFGTGFGPTVPALVSGGVVSAPAAILFDNVHGDVPVVASTAGYSSPALILTAIKN